MRALFVRLFHGRYTLVKNIIVIGAGPAGLTAAVDLKRRSDHDVTVFEANTIPGGIAATVSCDDNLLDMGGHRFFTKIDRVQQWWFSVLPLDVEGNPNLTYHGKTAQLMSESLATADEADSRWLVRPRYSRIYFNKYLLPYPLKPDHRVCMALGIPRTFMAAFDYARRLVFPIRPEISLRDFFVNRFGDTLYRSFFKEYTEKVWGVSCESLSADWGAQRVKSLSIANLITSMLKGYPPFKYLFPKTDAPVSLIEQFLYPAKGPGSLWEAAAKEFTETGGSLQYDTRVVRIKEQDAGYEVHTRKGNGETEVHLADILISSMALKDFYEAFESKQVPESVRSIASQLQYRDFLVVGLLFKELSPEQRWRNKEGPLYMKDTWIYVQEPGATVGRIQFFNNWSSEMVKDEGTAWIGMEYFVNEQEEFWSLPDEEIIAFAAEEFVDLGFARKEDLLSGQVVRVPKAYPVYAGVYDQFDQVREYCISLENFYPVGRNGMHRYNNQDHSMMTSLLTVDRLVSGDVDKETIWAVNTDDEYHEEKES